MQATMTPQLRPLSQLLLHDKETSMILRLKKQSIGHWIRNFKVRCTKSGIWCELSNPH